ncbi:SMI1/KNR4 family protein [Aliterella atlantica]|uniref:Knr4/Smi1-like domain-containing protein n=1 Tax=Aliterella atlantica CENA595 TaxID=1618023 RepID=A0A0D8ZYR9_9CYAN|nr:SMI1/KNR4 family protein [Aliterella atlantica]KJH73599.1 hypothetical protein UH38_02250 [Aliterella atlantica CENA595]
MTVLTETLDRLEYWLWQNHPGVAELLKPGLTSEEIDNQVQDLPVQLTQEIKELYQWTNGCDLFFTPFYDETLCAMPLENAIQYSYHQPYVASECELIVEKLEVPTFVMFPDFDDWIHFAICDGNESSPILVVTDDGYSRLAYSSITSMALTTLECYEQEIIHVNYDWGRLFIPNESLLKEFNFIRKRNNTAFKSDSIRERYKIDLE